jgi:hypothetical protein
VRRAPLEHGEAGARAVDLEVVGLARPKHDVYAGRGGGARGACRGTANCKNTFEGFISTALCRILHRIEVDTQILKSMPHRKPRGERLRERARRAGCQIGTRHVPRVESWKRPERDSERSS